MSPGGAAAGPVLPGRDPTRLGTPLRGPKTKLRISPSEILNFQTPSKLPNISREIPGLVMQPPESPLNSSKFLKLVGKIFKLV